MITRVKVAVVLQKDGRVLLIKEWSDKKNGYYWNVIKGTLGDHGDETLEECAKREALEEVGLEIVVEKLISCYLFADNNLTCLQFNFLGSCKSSSIIKIADSIEQQTRKENITEARWFTKKELTQLPDSQLINGRLKRIIKDFLSEKVLQFRQLANWD